MAIASRKVLQKRIPTKVEFRYKIVNYGEDNLYPQMVEQIAFRSPITESAIDTLQQFSFGGGFEQNGDLVVNRYEQTLNDILDEVTADSSMYVGWSLFFNTNILGGIVEILPIKFQDCRYGLPDADGRHFDIKYSTDWLDSLSNRSDKNIKTYPLWNKRDIDSDLKDKDIEDSEGFIHYVTPVMDTYPKCTFDSVLDSSQTNGEIQVFELSSIQSGFLGISIFKHPGKFASKKDKDNAVAEVGELTGADNSNSVLITEVPINFEGSIIENIPANSNDRLFEQTNENVIQRITARFGVPYPLLGLQPSGGGIFNSEQIKDSYTYYNLRTSKTRQKLVKEFNSIMAMWHTGAIDVGNIIEKAFEPIVETKTED